jgi:sodium transport system permease protein
VKATLTVFLKELRDAVRDRRSWIIALTLAMLAGPVVFVLMSNFVSGLEERVAEREVIVASADRAPSLVGAPPWDAAPFTMVDALADVDSLYGLQLIQ